MQEPDQSVIDFIKEHKLAIMATQRKAGPPQMTMINYLFDGSDYLITVRGQSVKAKHLRRRPELSLAIVDGRQQVIINGTSRLIEDLDEVVKIAPALRERAGMSAQTAEEPRAWAEREERVIVEGTRVAFGDRSFVVRNVTTLHGMLSRFPRP